MNLLPYIIREMLKNRAITYFLVAVMLLQLLLDVIGKFVDVIHKLVL